MSVYMYIILWLHVTLHSGISVVIQRLECYCAQDSHYFQS